MKILNLYAGIGGNRKLWKDVDVTAVELNPKIAKIYQDFFPKDKMVVADAHQYLLEHFKEYDFIWSSPPCPSHSSFRAGFSIANGARIIYPDMKLYEEILLLKHFFRGKWCIENVRSYYVPLIKPRELQRHYFWSNFHISQKNFKKDSIRLTGGKYNNDDKEDITQIKRLQERYGYKLNEYRLGQTETRTILRNCVLPELGLHILKESQRDIQPELFR